jgi:folate-binding protein YgfZ
MVPDISTDTYSAARRRSAFLDRSARGRIVVSGNDRATYLQGLLTNDVAALKAGEGCYAAYLTPQGRMIADLFVYEAGDLMLLMMDRSVKDEVLGKLEQFIFTEDVQLGDVTEAFAQVAVVGPEAGRTVSTVLNRGIAGALAGLPEHGNLRTEFQGHPAIVTRIMDLGEPGFELYVEHDQAGRLKSALVAHDVAVLDSETAEAIRIEAGIPLFGRDMDGETIPLEAGIESRAISFSKGCYVGQEVIIRVLDGLTVPAAGSIVRAADRDVGVVTSSAMSPALGRRPIALAYVHRDSLEPGTTLKVDGATAVVTALPFVPRDV